MDYHTRILLEKQTRKQALKVGRALKKEDRFVYKCGLRHEPLHKILYSFYYSSDMSSYFRGAGEFWFFVERFGSRQQLGPMFAFGAALLRNNSRTLISDSLLKVQEKVEEKLAKHKLTYNIINAYGDKRTTRDFGLLYITGIEDSLQTAVLLANKTLNIT